MRHIQIQHKRHWKIEFFQIFWKFCNNLCLLQKQTSYRFQDWYKRKTESCAHRITSQENFRETSNFPLYRVPVRTSESSRPEVATRWCGNKFKIWLTPCTVKSSVERGSAESGSKDSKMPQELLSFFRLNKKREKTHLRMCRTAIASILEVPETYSGNFIPGMVLEIRLMIPARKKRMLREIFVAFG